MAGFRALPVLSPNTNPPAKHAPATSREIATIRGGITLGSCLLWQLNATLDYPSHATVTNCGQIRNGKIACARSDWDMQQKIKYIASGILALVMAVTLSSCGSSQERAIKQQIDAMNDYADEFEKDPKSAKLAKIDKRIEEIAEKMKDMGDAPESLLKKYRGDLETAGKRYVMAKVGSAAGGLEDFLKGIKIPDIPK